MPSSRDPWAYSRDPGLIAGIPGLTAGIFGLIAGILGLTAGISETYVRDPWVMTGILGTSVSKWRMLCTAFWDALRGFC